MHQNIKAMYKIFLFLGLAIAISSCGKSQLDTDIEIIEQFIADNGLTGVQSTEDGLHYIITDPGGEEKPKIDDRVTVDYLGYYIDGTTFDSSYEKGVPLESDLIRLIPGWRKGLTFYGRGGRGMLLIPSELGYGSNPPSSIREDAVLIFEIVLIDFE